MSRGEGAIRGKFRGILRGFNIRWATRLLRETPRADLFGVRAQRSSVGLLYRLQGQSLQLPPSIRFSPLREGNRVGRVGSVPPACRGNLKEGVIGHTRFCELWLRNWYDKGTAVGYGRAREEPQGAPQCAPTPLSRTRARDAGNRYNSRR
jgi:hypothetical protein